MIKPEFVLILFLAAPCTLLADQMAVHIEPSNPQGTRLLQKQTADSAIRDYLQSWQSLRSALEQNRPEQTALGLHTRYQDRAHDLRIDFYSPDGLSIRLIDDVDYDQQAFDHEKILASERVRRRYIVVLTPTEVRWRVRVFQSEPNETPVAITKRVR
jgi:hypothetical protein